MRNLIIPAILVKTEADFRERLRLIEGLVDTAQIDVMDGHFVPNSTWCDLNVLRTLETPMHFELHLMVSDPGRYVDAAKGIRTVTRLIWHVETDVDHDALIRRCHENGLEAGLAINPKTPIDRVAPYTHHLDEILVMGVEPGWSGQGLIPSTIEKARRIRMTWPHLPLGFDGGVGPENIQTLKDAGVTRLCAASSIFGADYPRVALSGLEQI